MRELTIQETRLKGLRLISPFYNQDDRGFFIKRFEKDIFKSKGIDIQIQECFESQSHKGVLRGMHFQSKEPQAKLISCLEGRIFDVALDLRRHSKTFGEWEGFYLDNVENQSLYIPAGFAHGYLVLSPTARVSYQCHGRYLAESDTGIIWNDTDIDIKWPLHLVDEVQLSPRDQKFFTLKECEKAQVLPEEVLG
ncbi:dTDP-4-dehydrorhamnose 3,5-epimerase [Scatolibacter rhodanostii]|uniref:dTDP-4-dehydrorhamnose 3,5-epimerase n=1 Tax=Scatolibacter rhodanostii TaxID=2014781 RepID=UPI000C086C60|nr:dTDP-4-dehydrorhamnose 3,5-epimerase [Scatolibacter rhodanostii]